MLDPMVADELIRRHHRRLSVVLQALLPGDDTDTAFRETWFRIHQLADQAPTNRFAEWAVGIARQVAADRRKSQTSLPFSDDLFRQLSESIGPILDTSDARPAALARILQQLPPPERELLRWKYEIGMTPELIASRQHQKATAIARDLAALHGSLVSALREVLPDTGPEPPGGAADLGRLSDQLSDRSISEDGRLVLETLLLGDTIAQAHYHRHAALLVELKWKHRGPPSLPERLPEAPRKVSAREWLLTAVFVLAVVGVIAFAIYQFLGPRADP